MMSNRLFRCSLILIAGAALYPAVQASAEPVSHGNWKHIRSDNDLEDGAEILAGMLVIGGVGMAAGNSQNRSKPSESATAESEESDDLAED